MESSTALTGLINGIFKFSSYSPLDDMSDMESTVSITGTWPAGRSKAMYQLRCQAQYSKFVQARLPRLQGAVAFGVQTNFPARTSRKKDHVLE